MFIGLLYYFSVKEELPFSSDSGQSLDLIFSWGFKNIWPTYAILRTTFKLFPVCLSKLFFQVPDYMMLYPISCTFYSLCVIYSSLFWFVTMFIKPLILTSFFCLIPLYLPQHKYFCSLKWFDSIFLRNCLTLLWDQGRQIVWYLLGIFM